MNPDPPPENAKATWAGGSRGISNGELRVTQPPRFRKGLVAMRFALAIDHWAWLASEAKRYNPEMPEKVHGWSNRSERRPWKQ